VIVPLRYFPPLPELNFGSKGFKRCFSLSRIHIHNLMLKFGVLRIF